MKSINTYIIEKLKINKNSDVGENIDVKFGIKDEYFTMEEKEKCVELCEELPELPIQIIDGASKKNATIISNVVALRWPDTNGKMNFIGIQKIRTYGFTIQVRSAKYKRDYKYPKASNMLNDQHKPWLPTIEDVFKHIKEYWENHKNWNK